MKIEVKQLVKKFGSFIALNNLNLTIDNGMHGLLGPNGAGKTTFMRILSTLSPKTSGQIYFNDISIENKKEIRKIIGYLPQEFSFYPNFTVYEIVDYFGALSNKKLRKSDIEDILARVHLQDYYKIKSKALSGGMKRRLGIGVSLINNPKVLIVDEPTAGLDPEERVRFRNMLSEFAKDRVVLLSTHIVEDVALSCKSLAVINKGKFIYKGTVKNLVSEAQGYIWNISIDVNEVDEIRQNYTVISSVLNSDKAVLKLLSKHKPSDDAQLVSPTLEDAYMKLIKEV